MAIAYLSKEDELIESFRQMPKLANKQSWNDAKKRLESYVESESKSFALWLESKGFDGRTINEYWNEYNQTFK